MQMLDAYRFLIFLKLPQISSKIKFKNKFPNDPANISRYSQMMDRWMKLPLSLFFIAFH